MIRQVAEVDFVPVPYQVEGEGEPVIMIHLPTSPHHCFVRNVSELAKHFKVHVVDLRPAVVLKTWRMRNMKLLDYLEEVLLKFMDQLGLERVRLIGAHKAGPLAMYLTVRHPERIHKLVLYSTLGLTRLPSYAPAFRMIFFFMRWPGVAIMGRTRWIRQMVKWMDLRGLGQWRVGQFFGLDEPHDRDALTRHLVEIYTALLNPPDVFAYEVMIWTINKLRYDPVIPLIPKIDKKTLLVFGDDPYAVQKDKIEEYSRLIKNCEIMIDERSPLYPHYERADRVNKRTVEFLLDEPST
jgi:pimeloyl-ACP methyl ester carboxylesterase